MNHANANAMIVTVITADVMTVVRLETRLPNVDQKNLILQVP